MIGAVVLDIGNVLLTWQPEAFYDRMIGPGARRRLFAEVDLEGMNLSVDAGAPFRATVQATADAHPAWAEQILWWHDRWAELAMPVIDHSVRLQRALRRRGVPVFALTNFGDDSFALAQRLHPFLTEFDRLYVSGRPFNYPQVLLSVRFAASYPMTRSARRANPRQRTVVPGGGSCRRAR